MARSLAARRVPPHRPRPPSTRRSPAAGTANLTLRYTRTQGRAVGGLYTAPRSSALDTPIRLRSGDTMLVRMDPRSTDQPLRWPPDALMTGSSQGEFKMLFTGSLRRSQYKERSLSSSASARWAHDALDSSRRRLPASCARGSSILYCTLALALHAYTEHALIIVKAPGRTASSASPNSF